MSESKDAPTLPTIVDEAADSPSWLPMLGVALFCAVAAIIVLQQVRAGAAPQAAPEAPAEAAAK